MTSEYSHQTEKTLRSFEIFKGYEPFRKTFDTPETFLEDFSVVFKKALSQHADNPQELHKMLKAFMCPEKAIPRGLASFVAKNIAAAPEHSQLTQFVAENGSLSKLRQFFIKYCLGEDAWNAILNTKPSTGRTKILESLHEMTYRRFIENRKDSQEFSPEYMRSIFQNPPNPTQHPAILLPTADYLRSVQDEDRAHIVRCLSDSHPSVSIYWLMLLETTAEPSPTAIEIFNSRPPLTFKEAIVCFQRLNDTITTPRNVEVQEAFFQQVQILFENSSLKQQKRLVFSAGASGSPTLVSRLLSSTTHQPLMKSMMLTAIMADAPKGNAADNFCALANAGCLEAEDFMIMSHGSNIMRQNQKLNFMLYANAKLDMLNDPEVPERIPASIQAEAISSRITKAGITSSQLCQMFEKNVGRTGPILTDALLSANARQSFHVGMFPRMIEAGVSIAAAEKNQLFFVVADTSSNDDGVPVSQVELAKALQSITSDTELILNTIQLVNRTTSIASVTEAIQVGAITDEENLRALENKLTKPHNSTRQRI